MTDELQALVESLEYNANILETHNETGVPVKKITGGMRSENELIYHLVADINRVLTKIKDGTLAEVVRCENCEHRDFIIDADKLIGTSICVASECAHFIQSDHYCSFGKVRCG